MSLSGSLVLKDCQEDLAFVLVVEYFLLNYHRLYVHCIIYMEDRRQHARVGDFWEIEVIRLCGRHPKHVINISEQEALCVRGVQCSEL